MIDRKAPSDIIRYFFENIIIVVEAGIFFHHFIQADLQKCNSSYIIIKIATTCLNSGGISIG